MTFFIHIYFESLFYEVYIKISYIENICDVTRKHNLKDYVNYDIINSDETF